MTTGSLLSAAFSAIMGHVAVRLIKLWVIRDITPEEFGVGLLWYVAGIFTFLFILWFTRWLETHRIRIERTE